MATITVTPANVTIDTANELVKGKAGEDLQAGDWVYIFNNTLKLAKSDVAGTSEVVGCVANKALNGNTVYYSGKYNIRWGAVLTKDTLYYLSDTTAGKMELFADLASSAILVPLGVASTTDILVPCIKNTGIAKT